MTKRMLIDATHAEETRVVVLDGNRLEDFDVETSTKRQLKGNIYLAKVVRVEPSLQAAFVEYGGGRHGFLAFAEIHPDYYQIPVADRQHLLEMQEEEARREQEEEDRAAAQAEAESTGAATLAEGGGPAGTSPTDGEQVPELTEFYAEAPTAEPGPTGGSDFIAEGRAEVEDEIEIGDVAPTVAQPAAMSFEVLRGPTEPSPEPEPAEADAPSRSATEGDEIEQASPAVPGGLALLPDEAAEDIEAEPAPETPPPETIGGDADGTEERRERRAPSRFLRNYKIQEVIKRRQILLVQVVKEERGTKGAALTTYVSLAGRYCVLMPNSPRGGGISRKITSPADRRRLKEVMAELDLPKGMGLIVRTAGANRPKPEIKRDCEYLLRLWDDIREHTMQSIAPALIYEEASLIKRAIRDVYSRDIEELIVDGEGGWRAARDFMRMLMPSHVRKVQLWSEPQPLFARYQVDAQLDAMMMPTVQLRSGGYLVINQTEALVAIDVNSGRSTRERGIEETALRTNLEAAEEVARQLRLRDLAGLIVIDFIDMESRKNNAAVEKRLKEALRADRARIQVGHISHFGLLEMSRQRLRPSLAETNFILCPHCGGLGHVRSTESGAIHVLRGIEEEAAKRRAAEIVVHVALSIAMYILNHKRDRLGEIESRYALHIDFLGDESLVAPQYRIDRVRAQVAATATAVRPEMGRAGEEADAPTEAEAEEETVAEHGSVAAEESQAERLEDAEGADADEDGEQRRKRRRRRRRGGRTQEAGTADAEAAQASAAAEQVQVAVEGVPESGEQAGERPDGRRPGRRRRRPYRDTTEELPDIAVPGAEQPEIRPAYTGPTPADPFGGHAFDIFDVLERAEEQAINAPPARVVTAETEPVASASPEPVPEPAHVAPEPDAPDSASEPATPEPPPAAPAIEPILVGGDEPVTAERKRGWWRR